MGTIVPTEMALVFVTLSECPLCRTLRGDESGRKSHVYREPTEGE